MGNYYQELIKDLEKIVKTNPSKALELIEAELKLPYVPKLYLQKLQLMHQNILLQINDSKTTKQTIRSEDVFLILNDPNNPMTSIALTYLEKLDLKNYLNQIQLLLLNSQLKDDLKAIIYEMLAKSEIDFEFKIITTKKLEYKLNPHLQKSLIINKQFKEIWIEIEKHFFNNPSLLNLAQNLLNSYVLKIFPEFLKANSNYPKVFIYLSQQLLNLDKKIKLTTEQMQLVEKVAQIVN